jgi:GAF domain-containing protein
MTATDINDIVQYFEKNPAVRDLLRDPAKRGILPFLCSDYERIAYLLDNPWIDLERIIGIADGVMNISPDIGANELLNILCMNTAQLMNADGATCRTWDPIRKCMIAGGSYNWAVERMEEIDQEDSIAGWVIRTKAHYCVPDISSEPLYKEKGKILSLGINSMLALPIQLYDYEGGEKMEVLVGTLQLYFKEKNKVFFPQQIKLITSVVSRFSYVFAQKRKQALQKRSQIIQDSRKALISIIKRTQSLDQVLSSLVAKIAETINVKRCALFSIEHDASGSNVAVLIAGYPLEPFAHSYGVTLPFAEHPAFQEVWMTGQALRIDDAQTDPRMSATRDLYRQRNIRNVYLVPIKDENEAVTNVLVLDGEESNPIDKNDLSFFNALIQDIELCIQASIRSQERHDSYNLMLSFGAIAKVYAKKIASPEADADEIKGLYRKLYTSMLAVNDIITDRIPFAQKEVFNVNEVIAERLEAYYFPPQVAIEQNLDEGELEICADRKKVGRIVGNLIDNAHRKLEELQKGVLKIQLRTEGPYAVIEIGNTGSMPQEVTKNFSQDSRPLQSGTGDGRGQGLAIVKLFTVMHNGIAELESPAGENWTTFRVKLPLQ